MPDVKINREAQEAKLRSLAADLTQASATGDQAAITRLSRDYAAAKSLLDLMIEIERTERSLNDAHQAAADVSDPELQKLADSEITRLTPQLDRLRSDLNEILSPADPHDAKDVLVEIRAGAGGDEAALFAAQLFRMYARFAERQGWQTNLLSSNHTGIGGLKEVIFEIHGQRVYSLMKFESGVHRVQRVPETEKSGRVHTSTTTVAVVPIAEEADLVIDQARVVPPAFRRV